MDDEKLDYENLMVERAGAVRRVTLNRPERRNALSPALLGDLEDVVAASARDRTVSVIILRGAGTSFCSGYDIAGRGVTGSADVTGTGSNAIQDDVGRLTRTNKILQSVQACPIPVVAQVHGFCIAGGTDLALSCDIVIAADDARIGFPPVRSMGVPPTHMWLYHLGPQWTKRLLLTGDSLVGRRAAELGLVLEAVPADRLDDHVLGLATRMAAVTRDLLIGNKYVVNKGLDLMGRATLQDIAATQDAVGHLAPGVADFWSRAREQGLRAAFAERDAPVADGDPIT
jgi:enoyl-CoA hydratase